MKSNWVFCRTTKFRQGRDWKIHIESKVKIAYVYWEPGERRSNKQRLRTGHSAFWVGLNTEFPSLFRRTPLLPGSLPSQHNCQIQFQWCRFQNKNLGPVKLCSNPPSTSPKLFPTLITLLKAVKFGPQQQKWAIGSSLLLLSYTFLTMASLLWKMTGKAQKPIFGALSFWS